jgi:hypothetical protein
MTVAVTTLPTSLHAWARYCIDRAISTQDYYCGYGLLTDPAKGHAWMSQGFDAVLDEVERIKRARS